MPVSAIVDSVGVSSNQVAKIIRRSITPPPGFRLPIFVAAKPEILLVRVEVQHKFVLICGVYGGQVPSTGNTISPGILPAQLAVRVEVAEVGICLH